MGQDKEPHPQEFGPPQQHAEPLRSCNVYWPRRDGALQQRGDAAAPPPGAGTVQLLTP